MWGVEEVVVIDTVELLKRLVAIDSINPALIPGAAGETTIAHFIADWAEGAGLEVRIVEPVVGRPSVIAIARGTGGGKSLILNAHTDTVGVAGMTDPLVPRVEGNRLYGRGAYDMKAGLVAAMVTVATARGRGWRGDLILTAVSDEEHASIGTAATIEQCHVDAAIVTEPTGLDVSIAHKGFTWLELETHGIAAHGSRPDLGVDAIAKMGRLLVELERLDQQLRAGTPHHLLGTGSVHASLIAGGQELSSYPEGCRLDIERRTIPGETAAIVEGQIRAIIDRAAAVDPTLRATLRVGLVREPYEIATDAPIVAAVRRHTAAVTGREPAFVSGIGWMDSALLGAAGIPTVIFGPDGEGAHAVEEWADLDSIERCAAVLLATAEEFCA
jgi:acetylornithine deacetylase